jgi:hypothetical protein
MIRKHRRGMLMVAGTALLLAVLACTLTGGDAPAVTPEEAGEARPTRPSLPRPTPTPAPDVPGPGGCTLNAAFVADVTVPDGTAFQPGASFTKTWRVHNAGTCPWTPGTLLVFTSGDPLGGPGSVPVGPVPPDEDTELSVDLVAPAAPGTYQSNWRLQAPDGALFGSAVYVEIVVPAAATGGTATPSTAPPTTPPDLRVSAVGFGSSVLVAGVPFDVLATLDNDGAQPLSAVTVRVEDHFSHAHASCSNMDMVTTLHETTVDLPVGQSPIALSVQIDDAWEHIICVKVDPDDAIAESDESNNAAGQTVLVGNLSAISLDGANSGSVRADGDTNYANAQPGDGPNDQRVKGFLSWDLAPIPAGSEILSASVGWGTQCFRGGDNGDCTGQRDPFPGLGNLEVWAYYYETIDAGDFIFTGWDPGTLIATYTSQPTDSLVVTEAVADAHADGRPFQVYALFENDTDNNGIGNGVVFPEGGGPNTLTVVHMP